MCQESNMGADVALHQLSELTLSAENSLKVHVGSGEDEEDFIVHKDSAPLFAEIHKLRQTSGRSHEFWMRDIGADVFKLLLQWLVTAEIIFNNPHFTLQILTELWYLAQRLHLPALQNKVVTQLWSSVHLNLLYLPSFHSTTDQGPQPIIIRFNPLTHSLALSPSLSLAAARDLEAEAFFDLESFRDWIGDYVSKIGDDNALNGFWGVLQGGLKWWVQHFETSFAGKVRDVLKEKAGELMEGGGEGGEVETLVYGGKAPLEIYNVFSFAVDYKEFEEGLEKELEFDMLGKGMEDCFVSEEVSVGEGGNGN